MKRTKDTTVNSKGKFHKKKRFGKSIKNRCISEFDKCYNKEKALIEWIKANKIKILNSGIKIA